MPVYYYLGLANCSNESAVSYIDSVPINSAAKDLLKRRISNREVKYNMISNSSTQAARKKRGYMQAFFDGTLVIPSAEAELKYCLAAIRGMTSKEIAACKEYLLNVMYEIYTTYFNDKPFSSIKPEFRYALCWIDEALFLDR